MQAQLLLHVGFPSPALLVVSAAFPKGLSGFSVACCFGCSNILLLWESLPRWSLKSYSICHQIVNILTRRALNPTSSNFGFPFLHSLGSWYEDPQILAVCLMDWQGYNYIQQNKDLSNLALFLYTFLPVCLCGPRL